VPSCACSDLTLALRCQQVVQAIRIETRARKGLFLHTVPLCRAGALARLGVTPLLCGAATTPYAEAQRDGLRAAAPDAVVERRFLGPAELAQVSRNFSWA